MNKLSLFFLISASLLIGILDFATTTYGLSIGLIEADGLYIPFLSTAVLFCLGLSCLYISDKLKSKLFNTASIVCLSGLTAFMFFPIINNVSLII